jgi:hypothetical protein
VVRVKGIAQRRNDDLVRDVITREFGRLIAIAEVAPNSRCVSRAHLLRAETLIKMALNNKSAASTMGIDAVERALVNV